MFVPPVETRKSDSSDCTEGLCHHCRQWVTISTTKKKNSFLWFRHAHKCHVYIKPKSYVHDKRVKSNVLSIDKNRFEQEG